MNAQEALSQMEQLRVMMERMIPALKDQAVQEAVNDGAAVVMRPYSFRHPVKGECDPCFGLAYHQWLALRKAGFDGVFTPGDPESDRAVLYIIYDKAAKFLAERAAAQAGKFVARGEKIQQSKKGGARGGAETRRKGVCRE